MLGSARAPAQAVPARQATGKSRPARPRSTAGRVTAKKDAKKDDYVPGMYISQSQMELRLLEKLLKDKRKELAAYDLQLEEYMKIVAQTQRNMNPPALRPSTPTAGAISSRSSASSSLSLSATTGTPQATQEILDRLLAEKQSELLRLQQDVETYKKEVTGSSYALGYSPGAGGAAGALSAKSMVSAPQQSSEADLRAKRLAGMSDYAQQRLAELEGLMSGELKATREQIRRNEELKLQNDAQLKANQQLAQELLAGKSAPMQDSFAKPSAVASEISNTKAVEAALAKAGVKPGQLPPLKMPSMQVPAPAAPVPPPLRPNPATKIPTTPAAEEAARNFRKAIAEQPSLFPPESPAVESLISTAELDKMVAKSAATSRAAAEYTEPGLAKKQGRPWGPEVVLLAAAAAVEAAVDFAQNAIEESQQKKANAASGAAPAAAAASSAAAEEQEDADSPKEVMAEKPQSATEGGKKEPPSFGKLWSQKRKQGGA